MVADRPDWCISRQRFWGVPLIVFYCEACGKQLEDFQALRHVLPFFEREGADAWYTHSAEELLPTGHEMLVRRGEMAEGIRHSRRVVRFRLDASRRAQRRRRPHMARRCLSRRPRPVSRLVSELAARRHRHARPRALRAGRHARLDARRKGRADVEIARQRAVPQGNLRKMGRRSAAPLGRLAGLHRGHAQFRRR